MKRQIILITLLSCFCATLTTIGQTIEELFSIEGLTVNAYHSNDYYEDVNISYTFHQKEIYCDVEVLTFVHNETNVFQHLAIEDKKVYHYRYAPFATDYVNNYVNQLLCDRILLFDFGLEIGEAVESGMYEGYTLTDKYEITLDNGMTRMRHDLTSSNGFYSFSWIEGIGCTLGGVFPSKGDEFSTGDNFVCAKIGDEILMMGEGQEEKCDVYSCARPATSFDIELEDLNLTLTNNTVFGETYLWDFGDGTTSTEANPTPHTYSESGCYEVTLTAYNDCDTDGDFYQKNFPTCISNPWETVATFDNVWSLKVKTSANYLLAYEGTLLRKSTNNGATWKDISIPLESNSNRNIEDIKMYDEEKGIIIFRNGYTQTSILVTSDGGLTWEEKVPNSYQLGFVDIAEDGRAWTNNSSSKYYRSFDYGQTWEEVSITDSFKMSKVQYLEAQTIFTYAYRHNDGGILRWIGKSTDNGDTWTLVSIPDYINNFHFTDENTAFGFSAKGLYKTTDGGQSWELLHAAISTPASNLISYANINVNVYDFIDTETAWVVGDNGLVYHTNDGFETITRSNCGGGKFTSIAGFSDTECFATIDSTLMSFGEAEDIDCTNTNIDTDLPILQQENISVYPNPITDKVYINNESPSKVQILNVEGKILIEQTIEQGEQFIDTDHLKAGFYILKIETINNKNTSSFKLIKL